MRRRKFIPWLDSSHYDWKEEREREMMRWWERQKEGRQEDDTWRWERDEAKCLSLLNDPSFYCCQDWRTYSKWGETEWFGSKNNTCVSVSSGQFIQSVWGVREREKEREGEIKEREKEREGERRRRNILWVEGIKISISLLKWDNVWEENILESSFNLSLSVCLPLNLSLSLSVCLPLNLSLSLFRI